MYMYYTLSIFRKFKGSKSSPKGVSPPTLLKCRPMRFASLWKLLTCFDPFSFAHTPKNIVQKIFALSTCISIVWLFPVLRLFCVYVYHMINAVLAKCMSSVANWALNAVLAPLSAVVANRSSSALVANCSSSSFTTTRILGHYRGFAGGVP